jgi:pyruvate kinase
MAHSPSATRARTKIVATVGPACDSEAQLAALIDAGADVFRLNTAHGDAAALSERVARIRRVSQRQQQPIGILTDLAGPKIRLGQLAGEPLVCEQDQHFVLVRGDVAASPSELVSTYDLLIEELNVGDKMMLADGTVGMRVIAKQADQATLQVFAPGVIRSRQGINLPGAKISVVSPTREDLEFVAWAAREQIDFLGLSFVRSAAEIARLRQALADHHSGAKIIAKIEKPEAILELEAIVEAADGVMVARGDLGVEIDVAEIAVVQKRIIALCTALRKPVIVATQMLESMRTSRQPTRAEATDVANAILDGADACMLSGETAIGEFPREAVEMMNRIALATEPLLADRPAEVMLPRAGDAVRPITLAIVQGAGEISDLIDARLVVVVTRSGATAIARAKQRDFTPTIGLSGDEQTLRRLCLFWGITPLADAPITNPAAIVRFVDDWGRRQGLLSPGDHVVYIHGTGLLGATHDQVTVHQV